MGARARLKASFNCGVMVTGAAQMVCAAMKKYGMIVADNGAPARARARASQPAVHRCLHSFCPDACRTLTRAGGDWYFQGEASPLWPTMYDLNQFHVRGKTSDAAGRAPRRGAC